MKGENVQICLDTKILKFTQKNNENRSVFNE